jgi:hypothetical protein
MVLLRWSIMYDNGTLLHNHGLGPLMSLGCRIDGRIDKATSQTAGKTASETATTSMRWICCRQGGEN